MNRDFLKGIQEMVALKENEKASYEVMCRKIRDALDLDPELASVLGQLDYYLVSYRGDKEDIDPAAESVLTIAAPGGSEGVYIDGYVEVYCADTKSIEKIHFLTVKTLEEGYEALKEMGKLAGAIQYVGNMFLCVNWKRIENSGTKAC